MDIALSKEVQTLCTFATVKIKRWLLFLLVLLTINARAQTGTDSSVIQRDSLPLKPDTVSGQGVVVPGSDSLINDSLTKSALPVKRTVKKPKGESYEQIIRKNPYFNFFGKPMVQMAVKRKNEGKEGQFYLLSGLIFFFALIRVVFAKYLHNLFAVFFRVSMKQKQMREQLLQTPFPSLLLNLLFIITGGIYVVYLLRYYQVLNEVSFWLLLLYSSGILAVVYIVKLLALKLTGWVFNMRQATDTYIFIVFLVNKLLGILLLPFLLFIAFSQPDIVSVTITLSYCMVAIFFGYRYIISYTAVRSEIKVSRFHFFLYLCAFEIMPLVLIYKVLLEFVYRSH